MAHRLDGVRVKLCRADEHLETLDKSVQGFLKGSPYRPFADMDMEAGEGLVRVEIRACPPVLEWGVLVGDVLHNLRSALDHLAWQLGGDPPPNKRTSAFPIHWDRGDYRREGAKKVAGVPCHPQAIIEDLQPYQRGDEKRAKGHALWWLKVLSEWDKHRLLHVTGSVVNGVAYFLDGAHALSQLEDSQSVRFGPFEDGAVIARWPIHPDAPKPKMNVPFHFTFGVALGESGPAAGGFDVTAVLTRCRDYVKESVLNRLGPFLL